MSIARGTTKGKALRVKRQGVAKAKRKAEMEQLAGTLAKTEPYQPKFKTDRYGSRVRNPLYKALA